MSGWDAVRAKLEALAGAPERGTIPVVIAADKDVWHKWVMSCLDILQQLGYTKINFKQ